MRIELKKLLKLSVKTKSGIALGHVKDIVFEIDGQSIVQYEVGGLLGKKYLISREQVISIDEKKMIVDDNVVKIENKIEIQKKAMVEPEGVAMRGQ